MYDFALDASTQLGFASYKHCMDQVCVFEDKGMDLNVTKCGKKIENLEDLQEDLKYVLALTGKELLHQSMFYLRCCCLQFSARRTTH